MTPAEMREAAAVLVEVEVLRVRNGGAINALRRAVAAIRALPLPEDDCQAGGLGMSRVLAALPHLTGDELRRVAEAMPRVAGEWERHADGLRRRAGPMSVADTWPVSGRRWRAEARATEWENLGLFPTARAAQAACDARLEAAGVRLCGEMVRE